ncbi:MAG: hypothetical protein H7Z11_23425, partial [Verrucomicrobia bacterium]|nr:hypothetical protein [Leptolyngbya sp. ES-bin-22]
LEPRQAIPVENGPQGVTIAPDGRTAFVANLGAGSVSVVDLSTGKVSRRIEVGSTPEFILYATIR